MHAFETIYIILILTKQQYLVMCQLLSVEKEDHFAFSSHNQQSLFSTTDMHPQMKYLSQQLYLQALHLL